mmetsp:Transcript_6889/g.15065  ORF Transcript_6889/g.15065 Transcript_6889/m.15065 type:complete len:146 (+) Transcript_6889:620-1057(+)
MQLRQDAPPSDAPPLDARAAWPREAPHARPEALQSASYNVPLPSRTPRPLVWRKSQERARLPRWRGNAASSPRAWHAHWENNPYSPRGHHFLKDCRSVQRIVSVPQLSPQHATPQSGAPEYRHSRQLALPMWPPSIAAQIQRLCH